MTPTEIYFEFRTAPIGSLSPAASLVESGKFISYNVAIAYGVGYAFGTVVHNLIDTYAPEWNNTIGGTVDQALQNMHDAADAVSQGEVQKAWDDLFSGPVQSSGDPYGDYNGMAEMGDYIIGGGGGICYDCVLV
jgi:hypothetical protein